MSKLNTLELDKDGAALKSAALSVYELGMLKQLALNNSEGGAGIRLYGDKCVEELLSPDSVAGKLAFDIIGSNSKPVRAILFDKKPELNWSLGWHQDRTIVVQEKVETAGYGPWSIKAGLQHVEPPISLFEQMITMRIHLDEVNESNAPLLIAPASHNLGRIPIDQVEEIVEQKGIYSCLAMPGDIWMYRTPILHASKPSKGARHRRVLQVDFSSEQLPGELDWLGI